MRRGLQQKELARILGVKRESLRRYEADRTKPGPPIREKLRKVLKLNGEFDRFPSSP